MWPPPDPGIPFFLGWWLHIYWTFHLGYPWYFLPSSTPCRLLSTLAPSVPWLSSGYVNFYCFYRVLGSGLSLPFPSHLKWLSLACSSERNSALGRFHLLPFQEPFSRVEHRSLPQRSKSLTGKFTCVIADRVGDLFEGHELFGSWCGEKITFGVPALPSLNCSWPPFPFL